MADETALSQIKSLLGVTDQDEILTTVVELIEQRLKAKVGQNEVPPALQYIVVEASISRFNRINDEGKTSATENEVSSTWQTDDLAPFAADIADWVAQNNEDKLRKVRFL